MRRDPYNGHYDICSKCFGKVHAGLLHVCGEPEVPAQSLPVDNVKTTIRESMKPLRGHHRFYDLLSEIAVLHADKNKDYAGDHEALRNLKLCANGGIKPSQGCYVRMSDKWSRFEVLLKRMHETGDGPQVAGESLYDTLKDLAVYALLEVVLLEEEGDV